MGAFDRIRRAASGGGRSIQPNPDGSIPTHAAMKAMTNAEMMERFKSGKDFTSAQGGITGAGWSPYGASSYSGGSTIGPARLGRYAQAYGGADDSVSWVYSCVSYIATTGAAYPKRFVDLSNETTIENPPADLVMLLSKPNLRWTWFDLVEHALMDLELTGNSYFLLDQLNGLGQPAAIQRLLPERMTVAVNSKGVVTGYVYTLPSGFRVPYNANEIMHLRYPNPNDPYYGMGTVEAIASVVDRMGAMGEHITGYFINGARISGVLTIPTNLTDVQFERIKQTYEEQFVGSANAYKLLIAEQTSDYKPITQTPMASGTIELMSAGKDETLSAFNVPAPLLGGTMENANYKMEESQTIFTRGMTPRVIRIAERITIDITSRWNVGLKIDPNANEPRSVLIGYAKDMLGSGGTVDESRVVQGLPPLQPGDPDYDMRNRVLVLNTLIPASTAGQPPRPASAIPGASEQPALPSGNDIHQRLDDLLAPVKALLERVAEKDFDASEQRDDHGRWTTGGGGDIGSRIMDDIRSQGGGTINPSTGEEAKTGYAVAIPDHSSITSVADFEKDPTGVFEKWLTDNQSAFDSDDVHIGVWHDTEHGTVVLDPSEVFSDHDEAIQAGKDRDQIAIYHLDSGEEIPTGGSGANKNAPAATRNDQAKEADQGHDARGDPRVGSGSRQGGVIAPEGRQQRQDRRQLSVELDDLDSRIKRVPKSELWSPPRLPKGFEQISADTKSNHRAVREGQAIALTHGYETLAPVMRKFFRDQRDRVIEALSDFGDTKNKRAARLKGSPSKPKSELTISKLWDSDAEDEALRATYASALDNVIGFALDSMPSVSKAIADPPQTVYDLIDQTKDRLGEQIVGINDTTREAIANVLVEGLHRGYSIPQIANGYNDDGYDYPGIMGVFDQASDVRTETIARTESAYAFNGAQADLFEAHGVTMLEIIDGIQDDEECRSVNGSTQTVDWYRENPIGHPNCTRCAVPSSEKAVKEFDESEARDDHGRWTSSGGSSSSSDDADDDAEGDPATTPEKTASDIASEVRSTGKTGEDAANEINSGRVKDTLSRYTVDGQLTPERAELHAQIIGEIAGGHASQEDPQAIFTAGGPASGKSALAGTANNPAANMTVPDDSVHVDPDRIKAMLPEYKQLIDGGHSDIAAAAVHEESSQIAKMTIAYAYDHQQNVVIDGVGDSAPGKFEGKIKAASDAGYDPEVRYATVPTETAIERSDARYQRTGRYVSHDFITDAHSQVSSIYDDEIEHMDNVKIRVYDTSGPPKLVASKDPGEPMNVIDQSAYDDFKGKASASKATYPSHPKTDQGSLIEQPFDSADYGFDGTTQVKYPGALDIDGHSWDPPTRVSSD